MGGVLVAAVTGLVADAVSAGLLVVTTDGRVVWVNAALAEIVGGGPGAGAAQGDLGAERADETFPQTEHLAARLPETARAQARVAVAEARLPLSGLLPGASAVDVPWTSPAGDERWLRLRCHVLTPPGDSWADGLRLFEVFDVTEAYSRQPAAPGEQPGLESPASPAWAIPDSGQAWRGTPEWDQAAWGQPVTDDTVVMARPVPGPQPARRHETEPSTPAQPTADAPPRAAEPDTVAAAQAGLDRANRIEQLTHTGTWEWDIATNTVEFSPNLRAMLGFEPETPVELPRVYSLLPDLDLGTVRAAVTGALERPGTFTYIHRTVDPVGGEERVFECHGDVVVDDEGRPARVLGTAHDITDLHRVQRELAHLAEHDALTGLFNRRAITAALRAHLDATPAGRAGALMVIDVDHFKDINDLRGHAVGDAVMRGLAQVLRDDLPGAVLGRLGGDEFAVLLRGGDGHAGLAVAERLCQSVALAPIPVDGNALRVTVSIGVVPLTHVDNDTVALAHADLALYDAKDAGRDRARLFTEAQYERAALRVSATQRVRDALEGGTLAVDALPLVDLAANRVIGYELLVRLRDGLSPELSPREFLEPVERTELVLRLDQWVVSQAVAALAADGPHGSLYLHVNLSARSVEDPGFGDFVIGTLRAARVEPSRLGLEIAESSTLTSIEPARRLAEQVTAAGCRFILDDFGVGMGSVVHLRMLPFSGVKIDGDFVRKADANPQDAALLDAVVRIARTLGMYTIAENVDRESLARVLTDIGVDYAQGFHFGPPRPFAELLAERSVPYEPPSHVATGAQVVPGPAVDRGAAPGDRELTDLARAEAARLEAERLERERAEAEQREREKAETERLEAERLARERAEQDRTTRTERARRDQRESTRRRAEHRDAVSWDRPGLEDLVPGQGEPPPPSSPPPGSASAPPEPGPPSLPRGLALPGLNRPADAAGDSPGWLDGPPAVPPRIPPSFPAALPPGEEIPDYPPSDVFDLGGPPSIALPISGLPGLNLPGIADGASGGTFGLGDLTGDNYQGGGYSGYGGARPDPLGLERGGHLDPLFGPRDADGTSPAGSLPGGWPPPAPGAAPWDVVVSGPGTPGPDSPPTRGGGPRSLTGVDIGIVGLGGINDLPGAPGGTNGTPTGPTTNPLASKAWPVDGVGGPADRGWPSPPPPFPADPGMAGGRGETPGRPSGRGAHRRPDSHDEDDHAGRRWPGARPWGRRPTIDPRADGQPGTNGSGPGPQMPPGTDGGLPPSPNQPPEDGGTGGVYRWP